MNEEEKNMTVEKIILEIAIIKEGGLASFFEYGDDLRVGWIVSKRLRKLLIKEMKQQLYGDYLDPVIKETIETFCSCDSLKSKLTRHRR